MVLGSDGLRNRQVKGSVAEADNGLILPCVFFITKVEAVITLTTSSMARFRTQEMMIFVYNQASASVSTFSSRKLS